MPTYEYQCRKCGEIFEHFHGMNEEPLKVCPSKGCKGKVERLVSAGSGLIFKGSGFYQTDYKKQNSNGAGKKTKSSCPASEANGGSCPGSCSSED